MNSEIIRLNATVLGTSGFLNKLLADAESMDGVLKNAGELGFEIPLGPPGVGGVRRMPGSIEPDLEFNDERYASAWASTTTFAWTHTAVAAEAVMAAHVVGVAEVAAAAVLIGVAVVI